MLTIEDLASVPLFSPLTAPELKQLAGRAADIQLAAGEYAVHEGEERALFAVLSGKIEVTKLFDGIEKPIGRARAGTRSSARSRWRWADRSWAATARPSPRASSASTPSSTTRSPRRRPSSPRRSGPWRASASAGCRGSPRRRPRPRRRSSGTAGTPPAPTCAGFSPATRSASSGSRPKLRELESRWPAPRPTDQECPALRLADGTTLVRPRPRQMAECLGLQTAQTSASTTPSSSAAAPAGLAAAVYGASEGLRTLVVEREAPGGQAGTSSRIENYLGFPNGVSGDELASRALQQARRLGAEIVVTRDIVELDPDQADRHPRRRRRPARADGHHRDRRQLAPPDDRRSRPPGRQGRLRTERRAARRATSRGSTST